MPTGDSLAVFALLASAALACMIGALPAPAGWRATLLWAMAAMFALATIGWLFPPTQSPFFMALMRLFGAFAQSGALVMLGTVSIVALIHGRPSAQTNSIDNADDPVIRAASAKVRQKTEARSNRPFLIRDLDFARQSAYVRNPREAEMEWPKMQAALLSANKEFGIPMPPLGFGPIADLERGKRLLEKVIPLLRAGHDEVARKEAQDFVDSLKPKDDGVAPA